ncbi:MAG: hypothetical protein JWO02_2583 [Solirubrobacterales bacterium]|nr:hypothetical protein [Solirubrobacterales bacterium]
MPDLTERDVTEERRAGRRAGLIAFASVTASVCALGVANSASDSPLTQPGSAMVDRLDADRQKQLVDFAASTDLQAIAAGLRSVGLLLCIPVGLYLIALVRRRGADVSIWVRRSLVAGPLFVVAATIVGFLAFKDIADAYVASGPQSAGRAADLIESDGTLKAAGSFDLGSRIVFGVWVGMLSLYAMRVGLLTSFLGYWGVAAAGALVILPIGDAMFLSWLVSLGLLAVGYWPGGRPEAWERMAAVDGPAF